MANFLVIGALALDRPVWLEDGLERGGRVSGRSLEGRLAARLGGGGANAGVALTKAGHRVTLASLVATDDGGDQSIALAEAAGLDTCLVGRRPGESRATLILIEPDGERLVVFESGAILVYLGEKTGKFLPSDTRGRFAALQWLMFQMSAIGPQLGLLFRARNAADPVPGQVERLSAEVGRIFGVVEQQLGRGGPFIAGEYSIADIASFTWMRNHKALGLEIAEYPRARAWLDEIAARPAVQRGMQVLRAPRA